MLRKACAILTVVLLCISCTNVSTTQFSTPKPTPTPDATFQSLIQEYENRQIYDKLTPDILATIPDENLVWAIWDYIWLKVGDDYADTDKIVSGLSVGIQAFYYIIILQGEVDNGGYNQYFFNSSGVYANKTLEAFKLIGATELQQNLEKAISIHLKEQDDPNLRNLYDEHTLESFLESYKYTTLNECDEEFYALEEKLSEYCIRFVRAYPELFTGA